METHFHLVKKVCCFCATKLNDRKYRVRNLQICKRKAEKVLFLLTHYVTAVRRIADGVWPVFWQRADIFTG